MYLAAFIGPIMGVIRTTSDPFKTFILELGEEVEKYNYKLDKWGKLKIQPKEERMADLNGKDSKVKECLFTSGLWRFLPMTSNLPTDTPGMVGPLKAVHELDHGLDDCGLSIEKRNTRGELVNQKRAGPIAGYDTLAFPDDKGCPNGASNDLQHNSKGAPCSDHKQKYECQCTGSNK